MSEIEAAAARLRALIRSILRYSDAFRAVGAPARAEHGVLAWLHDRGPMSPKTLADLQRVRPQSMAQTLEALHRHQWIKRGPHPEDRRQILITLSTSGRKALEKARSLRQAWLVREMKKLPPNDRKTLSSAMEILERFLPEETQTPSKS
jgi:DNA-binding MarR family transcriptional regulator